MKIRRISFKNSSNSRFFVNMTYVQYPRNHSEPTIGSGIKFLSCRHPRTAIRGKIGGFRFKSPHREQILLLLLMFSLVFRKFLTMRNIALYSVQPTTYIYILNQIGPTLKTLIALTARYKFSQQKVQALPMILDFK